MANVFLSKHPRDIETAIMLDQAYIHDIGKSVAYTDGDDVFINTDDKLSELLPAYDDNMLKWLLWHERYHKELCHHKRYSEYLRELASKDEIDEYAVTMEEVNIIMDILVHDSLSRMFPELVETAVKNYAQMRNRNSLKYTFKTHTLEQMLDEYRKYKKTSSTPPAPPTDGPTSPIDPPPDAPTTPSDEPPSSDERKHKKAPKKSEPTKKPKDTKDTKDTKDDDETKEPTTAPAPEHDKTDWSKMKHDTKEFIDEYEARDYIYEIQELRNKRIRLAKLTETMNGLATSTRVRTYSKPSSIALGDGVILKGSRPGKATLYLCFDATGSMGSELQLFKEIITKSIPQALETPCDWFTSCYHHGKFKEMLDVEADSGFDDDGDRTIELCWKAEQKGYTPIGITDGGGQLDWSKKYLKQLKRTVIVTNKYWAPKVRKVNPNIEIIEI